MYILSQVLVFIADGFYAGSMLVKKKINLVIFLFLSDVIFATHYMCLVAFTGAIAI